MTTKTPTIKQRLRRGWPYILATVAVFAIAFFGSRDKSIDANSNLSLQSIANNNFSISADQVSEFYMVAEVADSMKLPSSNDISNNYVSVSALAQDSQSVDDTGKLTKPVTVDISHLSRGVVSYQVGPGDSVESIAAKYGVSVDDIRWSNNLKNTNISEGQQLLIPSVHGIAYTVKDGDSVDSLAKKYGASASDIIAYNDLENRNLAVGTTIILPSGYLPETERPEYSAPSYSSYNSYYSYSGYSNSRVNMRVIERWTYGRSMMGDGNRMTPGQCTWYAWYWRKHYGRPLPSAVLGNANAWAATLSRYGFAVNRTPSVGAVFQTASGYYGHVGIVTAVNRDGSITVREMNQAGPYIVTEANIPASAVGSFNYIH